MTNLKIKLNSEAEAEEVKRLAVKAGYKLDALFGRKWSAEFCYLVLCENMSAGFGNEIMADGDKPLSIGELRDMVVLKRNDVSDATHESSIYKYFKACDDWYYFDLGCTDKWQKSSGAKPEYYEKLKPIEKKEMKEYLMPSRNYEYILTDAREALEPHAEDWIEILEGAEALTKEIVGSEEMLLWWRDNFSKCIGHDNHLSNHEIDVCNHLERNPKPVILWQRDQDEPFLTPECTLNDQYAEIEQVRKAIKVKSGSDSDHALDAMSFGLMGAGAASSGAKIRENNHYFIDVSDVDEVDFYEIAKRYNVTDPAIQHILKKCLAIGNRGHKDLETDLKDILKTAKRALQINGFGE